MTDWDDHPPDAGDTPDDASPALRAVLDQLADGRPLDWTDDVARLDGVDAPLLRGLRQIAEIDAVHRAAEAAFDDTAPALARWRHLTILEALGEGRFGRVYRAFDTVLQIDVALKLSPLGPHESFDTSALLAEARLLAQVQHPHVVRIYGVDETEGRAGIWMEFVRGRTLDAVIKGAPLTEREAVDIGIQLSQALAAVHAVNVLHGDIKAHNVIRRENGEVVLVDFGAGRRLSRPRRRGTDVAGTLVYMAPEVLRGEARSQASDVYSLGVLLFQLVTGRYPMVADSLEGMRDLHERGQSLRLRDVCPAASRGFARVVERATVQDPRGRISSARALEAELRRLRAVPSTWWVGAAGLVLATGIGLWTFAAPPPTRPRIDPAAGTSADDRTGRGGTAGTDDRFDIEAIFYRVGPDGTREPLREGQTIRVGDELRLSVQTSAETYLYVINEDEQGEAYLLFPLAGVGSGNPLPPNREIHVPDGRSWKVTSAGGREHFVVIASRVRQDEFERAFERLPQPVAGAPAPLSPSLIDSLRGLGGLVPVPPAASADSYHRRFTQPLAGRETATGLWARQLTLQHPPTGR